MKIKMQHIKMWGDSQDSTADPTPVPALERSQLHEPEQSKINKPKLKGHNMVEISEAATKTAAVS